MPLAAALVTCYLPAAVALGGHAARMILAVVISPGARVIRSAEEPTVVIAVILRHERDLVALRESVAAALPHRGTRPLVLLIDLAHATCAVAESDAPMLARIARAFQPEIARGEVLPLTRTRRFDPVDRVWRGWELKRGKIEEFCRLLAGEKGTSFGVAPVNALQGVRDFVTLDVDTRLTPGAVAALRDAADPDAAIVAPAIELVRGPNPTLFERLLVPHLWSRPFLPRATFNQSRLGRDLFHGKGLIRAASFLARTRHRVKERTVLSHDLVESVLAGAVSTRRAVVREMVPGTRREWARRQERWARGDFQNLRWVFDRGMPRVGRFQLLEVATSHLVALGGVLAIGIAAVGAAGAASPVIAVLLLLSPAFALLPLELSTVVVENAREHGPLARRIGGTVVQRVSAWVLAVVYAPADAIIASRAAALVSWRTWTGRNLLAWDDAAAIRHGGAMGRAAKRSGGVLLGAGALALFAEREGAEHFVLLIVVGWCWLPLLFGLRQGHAPKRARVSIGGVAVRADRAR